MDKQVAIKEIVEFLEVEILQVFGNIENIFVSNLNASGRVNKNTLDWINPTKDNKQSIAESTKANVIIVGREIIYSTKLKEQEKVIIVVNNPKLAIAKIGQAFFVDKIIAGVHITAVIHPEAIIGANVFIGANTVIGKSIVGDNVIIHANVTIYDKTTIGNNVVIHAGAVICSDGLGCQRLVDGKLFEFPQLGGVIIEDDVYIGSNTLIASGSLSDTVIGEGCKINGLSFIGSNCNLGKNVWITGSTMLAGSVKIGKNTSIYSNVIIRDQCNIGEGVTIGMGSVVTKNIPSNEIWLGNPAKKK